MESIVKEPKTTQKINLIDGHFTSSEAADIINSVLNVKINFHKLNRLSITEGNATDTCEYDSGRIDELLHEQIKAKEFFAQARLQGKKLKMSSTIHISVED
ncbi:hypothetical protein [Aquimarina pacifica]|uniref:hypothetical protein n=1 Tax=Aquimarina pacifica TaxID=1296415 RepID=UPI0004712C8B|nr:hypothetical protein [Aquimarina pacifica]